MITLILRKKLILKQRCFFDGTLYVKIPKKSTENILSVSVLKNTGTENSISVFLSTDTEFHAVLPALNYRAITC